MTTPPQPAPYRPDPAILSLGGDYYDPVAAADFPETKLRFRNDRRAATVGLDSLDEWERRELERASRELKRQDD